MSESCGGGMECFNGGTCQPRENSYVCQCTNGHHPPDCKVRK